MFRGLGWSRRPIQRKIGKVRRPVGTRLASRWGALFVIFKRQWYEARADVDQQLCCLLWQAVEHGPAISREICLCLQRIPGKHQTRNNDCDTYRLRSKLPEIQQSISVLACVLNLNP